MWEIVNQDLGAAREKELIDTEEFWGLMLKNGSRVERHNNTQESAKRIVQKFVEKKKVELDIQNEIVRQQRDLHDTTAGKTLEYELAQERERSEQREAKARREYEKALRHQKEGLDELAKALQQQQEEARREVQKRNEDLERLKMSLKASDLRAENERRKRELQEKEQQRLKRIAEEKSKALNGSRFPVKPKTRSHPGPNRIQECRSITLIDDSYFFCGPDQSERCVLCVIEFQDFNPLISEQQVTATSTETSE
jgi:septal ring factor EnvC (AmiA/AmiB activator)